MTLPESLPNSDSDPQPPNEGHVSYDSIIDEQQAAALEAAAELERVYIARLNTYQESLGDVITEDDERNFIEAAAGSDGFDGDE